MRINGPGPSERHELFGSSPKSVKAVQAVLEVETWEQARSRKPFPYYGQNADFISF